MQKTQAFLVSRGLALGTLAGVAVGFASALQILAPAPPAPAPVVEEVVEVEEVPAGPLAEVESTAPETCQIAVRTTRDGQPLDGAQLALHLVGSQGSRDVWQAVTRDGGHRFVDLPRGSFHLAVTAEDRAARTGPEIRCDGDEARFFLDLDLSAAGTRVQVTPRSSLGALPEGAQVLVAQEAGAQEGLRGVLHLAREGDGFHARLRPGRYELMVTAPHHAPVRQSLLVGDAEVVARPKLSWRPEASGRVVDAAGNPVAGARIYLGPRVDPRQQAITTVSDDEGRFVLPVPPSTGLVLTARAPAGVATVQLGAPRQPEGHPGLSLQLREGREVAGWVTLRSGSARPFGEVRYRIKSLGIEGVVKANDEGAFVLAQMPHTDVELWAEGSAIGAWGGRVSTVEQPKVLLQWVAPAYAQQ